MQNPNGENGGKKIYYTKKEPPFYTHILSFTQGEKSTFYSLTDQNHVTLYGGFWKGNIK